MLFYCVIRFLMSCNTGSFRIRWKGRQMKTVNYKETYDKIPLVIQIDDDAAEGLEEIIYFLNENIRIIDNL